MRRWIAPAALAGPVLLAAGLRESAGAPEDTDEVRGAWRFRRDVAVPAAPGPSPGFAALPLPPQVLSAARPDLRDLRLVGADGREIPYVVDRRTDWRETSRWEGRLADAAAEKKSHSVWIVDLGGPRSFDTLELRVDATDFAKRLRVEAADGPDGPWRSVREDAGIFDRPWTGRVHHTTIAFREPVTARCLRLTADDRRTPPIAVSGAAAVARRFVPGERWRFPFAAAPAEPGDPKRGLYRLDLPPGLPFDTLELEADDSAFSRAVAIFAERTSGDRTRRETLGRGTVYRLRLDADSVGESLALPAAPAGEGGSFLLEIENGDSPPLRNVRGTVFGTVARLLFPVDRPRTVPVTLYYGNAATRAPLYDLEGLRGMLSRRRDYIAASLDAEISNPKYREAPPLRFAPGAGAPLEIDRWRWARRLDLPAEEAIYTVALEPRDVAALRDDLGDLRIAGADGRQVPYLLDSNASDSETPLRLEIERRSEGETAPAVSRYRLTPPPGPDGRGADLPLRRIRLEIAEPFFSRPTRLLEPPAPGHGHPRHHPPRVLFAGRMERPGGGDASPPVEIDLDGARRGAMILEIDDGDNAPLTVREARGSIRAPRAIFKLKPRPGGYRLLLGNPRAEPPRYDLEALRRELLAYSAAPVTPGALEPLAARAHGMPDWLGEAQPSAILWGALVLAVIVLLLLTVRLLRKTSGEPGK